MRCARTRLARCRLQAGKPRCVAQLVAPARCARRGTPRLAAVCRAIAPRRTGHPTACAVVGRAAGAGDVGGSTSFGTCTLAGNRNGGGGDDTGSANDIVATMAAGVRAAAHAGAPSTAHAAADALRVLRLRRAWPQPLPSPPGHHCANYNHNHTNGCHPVGAPDWPLVIHMNLTAAHALTVAASCAAADTAGLARAVPMINTRRARRTSVG